MLSTQVLIEEHRIITKMLDTLESLVEKADQEQKLDSVWANRTLEFFRGFADACHHGKEEDPLFTAMEEKAAERASGPVKVMIDDHKVGRGYLKAMVESVSAGLKGDPEALQVFGENARDLVFLLRDHIVREDNVVFPLGDEIVGGEDDAIMERFREIELSAGGDRHAKFIKLAKEICDYFGVAFLEEKVYQTITTEIIKKMGQGHQ